MEIPNSGQGLAHAVHKLLPRQAIRIMKLTALFITIACLQVSAHSYSQTVSFSGKNVPLQAIFTSIEKQTGVSFFFNYALLKGARLVSIDVHNATIDEVLDHVLEGQGLSYYKEGKTIFILKRQEAIPYDPSANINPPNTQIDLKGRVLNHEGQPLADASVMIKHTTKGATTDSKGMFEIKNAPPDGVLEISYTGYQRKEVPIEGKEMISIEMILADNTLDETQVIAYGTTTQRMSTGDVTTVKAEDIAKQPVTNPLLALEGRVPGLFISQATGVANGGVSVLIQGQNSITSGNTPFYVIDGVPYTSELLPGIGGSILGVSRGANAYNAQAGNPLSFINPSDIESITVLKDADATAIYGSRAANGAILITTKKGMAGNLKVDLNLQNGWGQVGKKLSVLGLKDYLEMRHEAQWNDGITKSSATDYDINGFWDSTRRTDWQKALIGNTMQYTTLNGTVSGGSSLTQYVVGGTYHRQTSVFPGSFADQTGGLHFNLASFSSSRKFKVQLSGSYLVDKNDLPNVDLTSSAVTLAPDAPTLYNVDGTLNWAPNSSGTSSWINPLASLQANYQENTTNFIGNVILSYQILPGLELKSNFGYNNLQQDQVESNPLSALAPESRANGVRSAFYADNNIHSWIVEPQLGYNRNLGRGRMDFLLGATIQENYNKGVEFLGTGYNNDAILQNIQAAGTITVTSSTNAIYRYNAGFARLTYNYGDKYIVSLTGRRDGSSRFGADNEFHDFGAIGAAWLFSNENFMKRTLSWLSFGKLRASYGTTGNDQIGDYQFLNIYTPINVSVPYQGVTGSTPSGIPNPYLEWEETKKLEVGLELRFWSDRISITGNYFRNRSSNELLPYSLPIITGSASIIENFPATVQNWGGEFTFSSINIRTKNFRWQTNLNITVPRNVLLAFPNLTTSSYSNILIIGKPISITKAYHFLGVSPGNGEYVFATSHGNATFTPSASTDMTSIINQTPFYFGGLENVIEFKRFTLGFLFQYMKRNGPNLYFGELLPGYFGYNQPTSVLKRWQTPGDNTNIQRYNSNASIYAQEGYANTSDAHYGDASFVRLKNVSLSWNFPAEWQRRMHFQNLKLFVLAQNVLTFTHYIGLDPETLSSNALPPLRIVTLGIEASF